jgi:hypothetical protein
MFIVVRGQVLRPPKYLLDNLSTYTYSGSLIAACPHATINQYVQQKELQTTRRYTRMWCTAVCIYVYVYVCMCVCVHICTAYIVV